MEKEPKLGNFIKKTLLERDLSLRAVSTEAGISHSYLSEIINGKKVPELKACNAIADFFEVPRIFIYNLAGWIETEDDNAFFEAFKERAKRDTEFLELLKMYMEITDEEEQKRFIRMLRAGIGK